MPCLSFYLSHCWVLLLFYYCVFVRCLINANVSRFNFTQHYLYECRLLLVLLLMMLFLLSCPSYILFRMPYVYYYMQFLSSFLFCPNSVQSQFNWTVLHCIAFFSSSPFCYFLSCILYVFCVLRFSLALLQYIYICVYVFVCFL